MRQSYPQRKALRLKNYNYAQNGAYFITLCTHNRDCLFGEVIDDKMVLNNAGRMVEQSLYETEEMRPDVILDAFIVMPNHIHVIFFLIDTPFVGADCIRPPNVNSNGRTQSAPTSDISNLIKGFKATVTKQINQYQKTLGMPVWQRGFYDHIIRNEEALIEIQQYIINNPAQWAFDENNSCGGDS